MDDALTNREKELVARHGDFYRALNGGMRLPTTPEQTRFVAVCRGEAVPETEHEIAFTKFVRFVKAQREQAAEDARRKAEAGTQTVEDEPGQKAYPSRLDGALDGAAEWASKNGFRI